MAVKRISRLAGAAIAVLVPVTAGQATETGLFGTPGLLDMPVAGVYPDGVLRLTASGYEGQQRGTLTFQATPRLTLSFRYARIGEFQSGEDLFDRSFDASYLILTEGARRPALAVGLRDIIGTGIYSGEYVVASKTLTPGLTVSAGLGWGRLGSRGDIGAPFGERPPNDYGEGGRLTTDQWFRGPAAPFAGLSWQIDERWTLKAEYSSDAYAEETDRGLKAPSSGINVGVGYRAKNGIEAQLGWLGGDTVAFGVSIAIDPSDSEAPTGREPGPVPVARRNMDEVDDLTWITPAIDAEAAALVAPPLEEEGIVLRRLRLHPRHVEIAIENTRYAAHPQAIGRTARLLSRAMPTSVGRFEITLVDTRGVPLSTTTLDRGDVERLEFAPAEALLARAAFSDATWPMRLAGDDEPLTWSLGPYAEATYFDPDQPLRIDAGLKLAGDYEIAQGLVLAGSAKFRLYSNRDDVDPPEPGGLPQVRTDGGAYGNARARLERLTLSQYARLAPDVYARATAGYLETAFGGVAGEVLWKPVDSRLGLGADVAWVKKRDYDGGFGFQDYDTVTGFLSAYYEFRGGYIGELSVGRYLAGDLGATLALSREFDNGWEVGAYVTRTDASFDEFGEGSFDKGITLTIPLEWATGTPSRDRSNIRLRSLSRDGGARVDSGQRLYDFVREGHAAELRDRWGRVWR